MYSHADVRERFETDGVDRTSASHFVCVTYLDNEWVYFTGSSRAAFTPVPTDILVAAVNDTAVTPQLTASPDATRNCDGL